MFKVAMSPTFWATVEVEVTAEKGGRQTVKFDLQYRRLSLDDAKALAARIDEQTNDIAEIAREIVTGWRGMTGDDNEELPFSPDNFERLLNLGFGRAIVDTYAKNLPRARVKN